MAPFAFSPFTSYERVTAGAVRWVREVRDFDRKIAQAIARGVLALLAWRPPAAPALPMFYRREHPPFDLKHWVPNMPRGHEQMLRGGARVTNADGVAGHTSLKTPGPIRLTGAPA